MTGMKLKAVIAMAAAVSVATGCQKEGIERAGNLETKTFVARCSAGDSETRATEGAGHTFTWAVNDTIFHFAYASSSADMEPLAQRTVAASEAGKEIPITVTYDKSKNEDNVIGIHKGSNVGVLGTYDKNSFTLAGGINKSQDGDLTKNMVSVSNSSLVTDDDMVFGHFQSFISFSLNSIHIADKDATRMVITDRSGAAIAGDITYNLSTKAQTVVNNANKSTTITIDSPEVNREYFVAIRAGAYADGFKIEFFNGSVSLGYIRTKAGLTVEPGKILRLGTLNFHLTVPGTSIRIIPTQAAIVNRGTIKMTKKIWVKYEPSDLSGITWTSNKTSVATVAAGPDEMYDVDGDGVKEMCRTGIVTPVAESGKCTITAALEGGSVKATCKIEVCEYMDLGLDVLWAAGLLKGDKGGTGSLALGLTTDYSSPGGFYMWGGMKSISLDHRPQSTEYTMWQTAGWSTNYGGRYNTTAETKLRVGTNGDDIAYFYDNKSRLPGLEEAWAVQKFPLVITGREGVIVSCYTSDIPGYTDVTLVCRSNGTLRSADGPLRYESSYWYWCNEVWTRKQYAAENAVNYDASMNSNYNDAFYGAKIMGRVFAGGGNNQYYARWAGLGIKPVRSKDYSTGF